MAGLFPDELLSPEDDQGGSGDFLQSLSDIAASFVGSVAQSAAQKVDSNLNQPVRSQNTAPVPDLTSAAATPGASFINSSFAGISIPVLLVGAAAVLFLVVRR